MGNFSRNTFKKLKHYVGIRLQQGVPIVDADWNELEDIRKYELQAFLKWFVGDGVPKGFHILPAAGEDTNFVIKGGDGTPEGAGRCLVEGWDVLIESDLPYTSQKLYQNTELADSWHVDVLPELSSSANDRSDLVYLDVWEREVNESEDPDLVNEKIGIPTCVRIKCEWVVRVLEGCGERQVPADWQEKEVIKQGHVYYPLALLLRNADEPQIDQITDLRRTGLGVLSKELTIKDGNVGVGTDNPKTILDIQGIRDNIHKHCLVQISPSIANLVTGSNNGGAIYFGVDSSLGKDAPTAAIETSWGGDDPSGAPYIPQIAIGVTRGFSTQHTANMIMDYLGNTNIRQGLNSSLYVQGGSGNVGVGTTKPEAKLHVNGTVKVETAGLVLDGKTGYVSLPPMNPDYAAGFTIEAWVRYRSFKSWSRIIDFGNGQSVENIIFYNERTSNNLCFNVVIGPGTESMAVFANGAMELNTWMHLAATVDAAGNVVLYKNGQPLETLTSGTPNLRPKTTSRSNNYIGKSNWEGDGFFDGYIRDVRVWNTARTAQQISNDMFAGLSGTEPNLVAWWPLDSASQSRDLGPNQFNGTIFPGATFGTGDGTLGICIGYNNLKVTGAVTAVNTAPLHYQKAHRRIIFGLPGDSPLSYGNDWKKMREIIYGPFGYAFPAVQAGAIRRFRLYAIYGDNMTSETGGQTEVRFRFFSNDMKQLEEPGVVFGLGLTGGDPNIMRDGYSSNWLEEADLRGAGHGSIDIRTTSASATTGTLWYLELQAYDVF